MNTSGSSRSFVALLRGGAFTAFAVLAALAFDGCAAPPPPGPPPPPEYVPELRAEALFFGDRINAVIELAAELPGKGGKPSRSPAPSGAPPGPGGPGPGGGDRGGPRSGGAFRESTQPALRLVLSLASRDAVPRTVEVRTLASQLGDFAVRPERLMLQPGRRESADPMFSRGYQGGDIVVTLTLRQDGQTETRLLTLRPVSPR